MNDLESISIEVVNDGRVICFLHKFKSKKFNHKHTTRYGDVTFASYGRLVRLQIKLLVGDYENG